MIDQFGIGVVVLEIKISFLLHRSKQEPGMQLRFEGDMTFTTATVASEASVTTHNAASMKGAGSSPET